VASFSANFSYNFSLFLCGIGEQIITFFVITETTILSYIEKNGFSEKSKILAGYR